ncbi:MAG: Tm-1-like ATP-binding domain-containing protein [Thermodesulfobacteriota bacterium]
MKPRKAIVVLGTFDSKGEEHLFLKQAVERRGHPVLTVNVGTRRPEVFTPDYDLRPDRPLERDLAIQTVIDRARGLVRDLHARGEISGLVSAGGGSGTHIATQVMQVLPLDVPKVMVSTVASRNMATVVGTKDIIMMPSVADLLGVNSISGLILDRAAAVVCGLAGAGHEPSAGRKRIALTMFGFITRAAEMIKARLEAAGHEVIAFHANGAGGLAMEELAREGRFDALLDLATHELADSLKPGGYCHLIGPGRLEPVPGLPRLVVPGGLDCVVLEFTRDTVPLEYRDRKIFFYDFRSAIRLSLEESRGLGLDLAERLNRARPWVRVLVPLKGWSEADRTGGPLYDPEAAAALLEALKTRLDARVPVREVDRHINDPAFALEAAQEMEEMLAADIR